MVHKYLNLVLSYENDCHESENVLTVCFLFIIFFYIYCIVLLIQHLSIIHPYIVNTL